MCTCVCVYELTGILGNCSRYIIIPGKTFLFLIKDFTRTDTTEHFSLLQVVLPQSRIFFHFERMSVFDVVKAISPYSENPKRRFRKRKMKETKEKKDKK